MAFKLTPVAAAAFAIFAAVGAAPLAAVAQTVPAPAAAASAAEARRDSAAPQTITITASGRAVTASKVPYNVTAIGEQALRDNNITDAKKLIAQSMGIDAPGNGARFADSVTVRGLNVSPVNANNIEYFTRSTLSYYIDDTPLPNLNYRIKDVARVETLLGPQGTLYGAGSLGGTVRYITNKPRLGVTEGRLNTSFYQTADGGLSNDTDAVFNLPIGSTVALRGAVSRLDEAGYTDRISNPPWRTGADAWSTKPDANRNLYKDDDWQKVTGGRFSALWQPARGFGITFAHTTQDQLAHGTSGASVLPLGVANARTPAERDAAWRNPLRGAGAFPCAPTCVYTDDFKTPYLVDNQTIVARYPEFADRTLRMNSVDVDIDLGFATLHSSTSQFKDKRVGEADYATQGYRFYFSFGDLGGAIDSGRSAFISFDNSYKGLSQELRLTSKGDGPLSWIAGLYHTRQDSSLKFFEVLPGMDSFLGASKAAVSPKPDVGYGEDLSSRYRETAVYGEATYRITQPWSVTGGVRVFNYKDRADVSIIDYAGGFVDNQFTADRSESGRAYYKLNTAYQITPDLLTYLTFSQGFRRGGANGFRNQSGSVVNPEAQGFKPDSTDNYELGVKGKLLGGALYVEASLYRIDWKKTQTYYSQDVGGFPVNGTANGPDSRTQGMELTLRYEATEALQFTFRAATSKGEWTGTKNLCLYTDGTGCRPDPWTAGGSLGGSPKLKYDLGARYQVALAGDYFLTASGVVKHNGKVQSDRSDDPANNSNVRTYEAYTRYDARLGLAKDAWEVSLWAENISDVRALTSNQNGGAVIGRRLITTTPRTVGLNLSYSF